MNGILLLALAVAAGVQFRPIPIVPALFATDARNVGPAYIYDRIGANGEIARVAYSPTGATETHSIYQIDTRRNCIAVIREETWNHPPTQLQSVQTYPDAPCWINSLTIQPGQRIHTEIRGARWTWVNDRAPSPAGPASGVFNDWTTLTAGLDGRLHLLEYYDSRSGAKDTPYCMQGDYDAQGLARLTPGRCQ